MKYVTFILLFLQVFAGYSHAERETTTKFQIANDTLQYREKVYLHLDRAYYHAGDDLWFKAYLVSAGTHLQGGLNNVLYVDIIGPQGTVMDTKIIKIVKGSGHGDFVLPKNLPGGEYTVRAYTNYMRNFDASYFFRKRIYINALPKADVASKNTTEGAAPVSGAAPEAIWAAQGPDLQFFPEGGQMVNGHFNRVGFKATGADGKGVDVSGTITAGKGDVATEFATSKFGMGMLDLMPVKGKQYTAVIDHMGTKYSYELPQGTDTGTLFRVQELKDYYQVSVLTTLPSGIGGFRLIGTQRNGKLYDAKINGESNRAVIKIAKDLLGTGIVQFTLLDQKDNALCERLVFYDGGDTPDLKMAPASNSYSKGGTVELEIALALVGTKVAKERAADLSISVTELAAAQPREGQPDIRTYLLLNSEIKGEIESPGYYFYSDDSHRRQHLDLLMMAQGWRQFILEDAPKSNGEGLEYYSETGITVEGDVLERPNGKKVGGANVSLTYWDEGGIGKDKLITDEDGHFKFLGLDLLDKSSVVIEAKDYKRGKSRLFVELDSLVTAPVDPIFFNNEFSDAMGFQKYMEIPEERERINTAFVSEAGLIELDEVVVKSWYRTLIDKRERLNSIHRTANTTIDYQSTKRDRSFPSIMASLRGKVPGLSINEEGAMIRGTNTFDGDYNPLYLLDGVEVDFGTLNYIAPWEVDFVDILKGGRAAIYGARGMNGVIAVYTIRATEGTTESLLNNPDSFRHQGFYPARKFYEPAFGEYASDPKNGYNTTLYWEPLIALKADGAAKINFPAGTRPGSYKAIIQGITSDGEPIATETVFEVN